ncbi:MAG: hypothetical protein H6620_11335 [Halobacteriovoraceae bacterium]|nr:hypothetical protein [Halobacteriovoraceae bacterium]
MNPFWDALDDLSNRVRFSTGCYRGFHVQYTYDRDQLYLEDLTTYLRLECCPTINGVRACGNDGRSCGFYKNLMVPISDSFGLLIGREDIMEDYYPSCLEYEIVRYLQFKNGSLVKEVDISDNIEFLRHSNKIFQEAKDAMKGELIKLHLPDYK